MTGYYEAKLNQGQEYQDFVVLELYKQGIIIQQFGSKRYQNEIGESLSRYEIKYDSRISETGNVYIEIAEKSNAQNQYYVKSGVFRDDNTWLYCIGDNTHAYIISKKLLQQVCNKPYEYKEKRKIKFKETPTSQGYVIPEEFVRKCLSIAEVTFTSTFKKE